MMQSKIICVKSVFLNAIPVEFPRGLVKAHTAGPTPRVLNAVREFSFLRWSLVMLILLVLLPYLETLETTAPIAHLYETLICL